MCADEICTVRPETYIQKVNRVNLDYVLTCEEEIALAKAKANSKITKIMKQIFQNQVYV